MPIDPPRWKLGRIETSVFSDGLNNEFNHKYLLFTSLYTVRALEEKYYCLRQTDQGPKKAGPSRNLQANSKEDKYFFDPFWEINSKPCILWRQFIHTHPTLIPVQIHLKIRRTIKKRGVGVTTEILNHELYQKFRFLTFWRSKRTNSTSILYRHTDRYHVR